MFHVSMLTKLHNWVTWEGGDRKKFFWAYLQYTSTWTIWKLKRLSTFSWKEESKHFVPKMFNTHKHSYTNQMQQNTLCLGLNFSNLCVKIAINLCHYWATRETFVEDELWQDWQNFVEDDNKPSLSSISSSQRRWGKRVEEQFHIGSCTRFLWDKNKINRCS